MPQVIYQSTQTAGNVGSSVVLTKPTSLAVGDLMVAQIVAMATDTPVVATPTGWTLKQNNTGNLSGATQCSYILHKIATAADVAATNFTFTSTGTSVGVCGALSRFSSTSTTLPVDQSNGSTGASSSAFSTAGITPTKDTGMFLIFTSWGDNASGTTSSYAIATQNPTWIEAYDTTYGDIGPESNDIAISMAYGSRNTLAATGNATATLSGARAFLSTQIVNILPEEIVPVAGTIAVGIPSIPIILEAGIALVATIGEATVSIVVSKWSNASKNVSTWIITNKS